MVIVKDKAELKNLRESGRILSTAIEQMAKAVKPGVTTKELDQIAYQVLTQAGAKPSFLKHQGFPASVCISINDQIVHGIPSERAVFEGDIVTLDVGANYKGSFTDCAVTLLVGKVSREQKLLVQATAQALKRGIAVIKPGKRTGDIGNAIQKVAEQNGLAIVRDLVGHGTGRAVHEDPMIPNFGKPGEGTELVEGMVFALEPIFTNGSPGISLQKDGWTINTTDGSMSSQHERTVIVTKDGAEILTPYKIGIQK